MKVKMNPVMDNDDDEDSGEWVSQAESDEEVPEWGRRVSLLQEGSGRTMELTCFLEECRVTNEGRLSGWLHESDQR